MKRDALGLSDLITAHPGKPMDPKAKAMFHQTVQLTEVLRAALAPLRVADPGGIDGIAITACVVLAGAIHGEMLEMGVAPDLTEEAVQHMLSVNWAMGVRAGRNKVQQVAAEMGVDPLTGRKPE